jgi:hypothetical protein
VLPLVAEVTVADAHQISPISRSPRKTDQHDALVLAKLLAAHLLPAVGIALEYAGKISQGSSGRILLPKAIKEGRVEGVEG